MNILINCFRWLWPVAVLFLPSWLFGLLFPVAGAETVWNPVDIILSWGTAVPALFAYSPAFCCGALFTLALCLYWHWRWPSLLYAFLLFFASCMAGPSWVTIVRLWHYLHGQSAPL